MSANTLQTNGGMEEHVNKTLNGKKGGELKLPV